MARRGDVPTRHRIRERIDESKKDMEEKEDELDGIASDKETVTSTLEKLDLGGTQEGSEQIEGYVEGAEDVTVETFDRENDTLEQVHGESQEHEGELQDRRGSSESDLGRISDAGAKIDTKETITELEKAREAVSHDIEFLSEERDRARDAREKSDAIQEGLKGRVHSGKRRR